MSWMPRLACVVTALAWLAAGGLGFTDVACLCTERIDCILPIVEACAADDGCEDPDGEALSARPCECGPCIDLPIANNLLTHDAANAVGPATIVESAAPAAAVREARAGMLPVTPAGPSPPAPTVLRC